VYGISSATQKLYLNDIIETYCVDLTRIKPSADGGIPTTNNNNGILQNVKVSFDGGSTYTVSNVLSYYKDPNLPDGLRSVTSYYNPLTERSPILPRVPKLTAASNFFFPYNLFNPSINGIITDTSNWSGSVSGHKVADIDECPADYYLIWMDRTGAVQCQPFAGKTVYSENISTTYRTDFLNKQVAYEKGLTGAWTLNTAPLDDEHYKVYASITTSPYIWVYDTKKDAISVANGADNSWTEKTWKNQKKLFSLNITVRTAPIQYRTRFPETVRTFLLLYQSIRH
jgi:hypothetical protein